MMDLMAGSGTSGRKLQRMIAAWFDEIDEDDSGQISFEEFRKWYTDSVTEYKSCW